MIRRLFGQLPLQVATHSTLYRQSIIERHSGLDPCSPADEHSKPRLHSPSWLPLPQSLLLELNETSRRPLNGRRDPTVLDKDPTL